MNRVAVLDVEAVASGAFEPLVDLMVSERSKYHDDVWDFRNPASARSNAVPQSRLQVRWDTYTAGKASSPGEHIGALLPDDMVRELKVLGLFALKIPGLVVRKSAAPKPQTVVVSLRALVRFLSHVVHENAALTQATGGPTSSIRSIGDISLEDMRLALINYPYADGEMLRKVLRWLTVPLMTRYLASPLRWTDSDLDTLRFRHAKVREDYKQVMPDELFRFLTLNACRDVGMFLAGLGISRVDVYLAADDLPKLFGAEHPRAVFEDYVAIRLGDRVATSKAGRFRRAFDPLRESLQSNHGVRPDHIYGELRRIQRAAHMLIGLYTGGRHSDLSTFKQGCIEVHHGIHVIRGTEVKNSGNAGPENQDLWPAIPAIRDAIRCLDEISRVTFNPYYVASMRTVTEGDIPAPFRSNSFRGSLNLYLREADRSGRWADWILSPHQLRHTLAHQLARADVGLVFIAQQMKHLHSALSALAPKTTIGYGKVGDLAYARALQAGSAQLEVAKALYSPDAPVAGGGAEEYRQRRKAYFEGMAAAGLAKDDVIATLAKQALPFASVGIAYCGGRREIRRKDGTKEKPPCLGSLQCQPGRCGQAIITRVHVPQWRKVLKQNEELSRDPRMEHAKDVFDAAAKEAAAVLAALRET